MNRDLSIFLLIEVALLLFASAVRAVRIYSTDMTQYELKRRAKTRNNLVAKHNLRTERAIADLSTLRYIIDTIIVVIVVIYTVSYLGWLAGFLLAIALLLLANIIVRFGLLAGFVQKFFHKYEIKILNLVEKAEPVLRLLRIPNLQPAGQFSLHSKEELLHLVEEAKDILSQDDRDLLLHAATFQTKLVKSIMTPRSKVHSLDKKELLGPLVLDDLHKAGHSRFPIIHRDIDHVVGILHVQDLLKIDSKKSTIAEKAMEPRVFYIHEDQTAEHALAAFLRSHHHLFIVINEYRETVGILSLEDVVETLIGRKIDDEFDNHEDLRVVAARVADKNNQPEGRVDV